MEKYRQGQYWVLPENEEILQVWGSFCFLEMEKYRKGHYYLLFFL